MNTTAPTQLYTLSLHDALPIWLPVDFRDQLRDAEHVPRSQPANSDHVAARSEEHTSELQSLRHLVCRLLLEKKRGINNILNELNPVFTINVILLDIKCKIVYLI